MTWTPGCTAQRRRRGRGSRPTIHSSALGHLRRELIDTLGIDRARGLLTRAGYVSGARDAQLVRERWPQGDAANVFMAGTRLHALEGAVKVTPLSFEFDIDRGTYEGEFLWEHSSEDDEHIAAYGIGTDPVAVAKILSDFAKGNDKFVIRAGAMPGQVMSAKDVVALASLRRARSCWPS